jgi:hypothetical protein
VTDKTIRARNFGVPEGRTEGTERFVRTIYPDGTSVDSEPVEVDRSASPTWAGLAGMFAKASQPPGTQRRIFTRTVVTVASEWTEVDSPEGASSLVDVAALKADPRIADPQWGTA